MVWWWRKFEENSLARIIGVLWDPVLFPSKKGCEMPLPHPKTSGRMMSPLSELVVSLQPLGGKCLTWPWRNTDLLSSLVVGTKQQRLLLPWTYPFRICEAIGCMSIAWTRCSCTRKRSVKKDHYKSEQTICWFKWWSHMLLQRHFKMCVWLLHLWLFYDNKHCFQEEWRSLIREKLKCCWIPPGCR